MCVSVADLNRDKRPDVYVTNIGKVVKDEKYVLPNLQTHLKFNVDAVATMRIREADTLYMSIMEKGELARYTGSKDIVRGATSTAWALGYRAL